MRGACDRKRGQAKKERGLRKEGGRGCHPRAKEREGGRDTRQRKDSETAREQERVRGKWSAREEMHEREHAQRGEAGRDA